MEAEGMTAGQPLLKVDGPVKRFGGLLATDHAHPGR